MEMRDRTTCFTCGEMHSVIRIDTMPVCIHCLADLNDGRRPGDNRAERMRKARDRTAELRRQVMARTTVTVTAPAAMKTTIERGLSSSQRRAREDDNSAGGNGEVPASGCAVEPVRERAPEAGSPTKATISLPDLDVPPLVPDPVKATIQQAVRAEAKREELALIQDYAPEVDDLHVTVDPVDKRMMRVTAFIPDYVTASCPDVAGRVAQGLGQLARDNATNVRWTVTCVRRDPGELPYVGDNSDDNSGDVEMLDFPTIARTTHGLSPRTRCVPIRAVWDILTVPHFFIGTNNIPDTVKSDRRVLPVVKKNEATIRRLRAKFQTAFPDAHLRPSVRMGRIIGIDHITGHAAVEHTGGIVVHWPSQLLMPIPEDEPLPPDIFAKAEELSPSFDSDDFRARRKRKRG